MVYLNICSKKLQTNLNLQNLQQLSNILKSAIRMPEETQLCHHHNNCNNHQQQQTFRNKSMPSLPTTPVSPTELHQGDKPTINKDATTTTLPKGNPYWPKNVNTSASPAAEQAAKEEEGQSAFWVFHNEVL